MNITNTTNFDGEWIINENIEFAYSSSTDSEPSSIRTDTISDQINRIYSLASFQAPILSSFNIQNNNDRDASKAIFEAPTKYIGQNLCYLEKWTFVNWKLMQVLKKNKIFTSSSIMIKIPLKKIEKMG